MTRPTVEIVYREVALLEATAWLTQTALGTVAVILCTLAVAFVGLRMASGHLSPGTAFRVVLGCFIIFGAPTIAGSLMSLALEG